jgi:hypothetical protein
MIQPNAKKKNKIRIFTVSTIDLLLINNTANMYKVQNKTPLPFDSGVLKSKLEN